MALLSIAGPSFGQGAPTVDESMNRRIASAAKASLVRIMPTDRSFHDSVMVGASDKLFVGESLLTPYRPTASDSLPNGITWKVPNTNLALSNGSAWFRRAGDAGRRSGARLSVQLTY